MPVQMRTHALTTAYVHQTEPVRRLRRAMHKTHVLVISNAKAARLHVWKTNSMVVRIKTTASTTGSVMAVNALRPVLAHRVVTTKYAAKMGSARVRWRAAIAHRTATVIKSAETVPAKNQETVHVRLTASVIESASMACAQCHAPTAPVMRAIPAAKMGCV